MEQVVAAGGGAGVGGGAGAGKFEGEVEPATNIHLAGGEDARAVAGAKEAGAADFAGGATGAHQGRGGPDGDVAGGGGGVVRQGELGSVGDRHGTTGSLTGTRDGAVRRRCQGAARGDIDRARAGDCDGAHGVIAAHAQGAGGDGQSGVVGKTVGASRVEGAAVDRDGGGGGGAVEGGGAAGGGEGAGPEVGIHRAAVEIVGGSGEGTGTADRAPGGADGSDRIIPVEI